MWPTKAYIYLYIVHLKHIYNSYSQRRGEKRREKKKSSKQDIMSNTVVPTYTYFSFVLRGKPGGRLIAGNLRAAHTDVCSVGSHRFILTANQIYYHICRGAKSMRSIQTICNKSDLNITSGMIARCVGINIAVVKPLSLVGGCFFVCVFFGGLCF